MDNEVIYSEETMFEKYANELKECKKETILGILRMGKIFTNAKRELVGIFEKWLLDKRVSISLRTVQRYMGLYSDYRHILESNECDKDAITNLDFSHLLELRKLPEKYKKTIDIKDDNGHLIKVDVMDETKLSEFLNKSVVIDGKVQMNKNLPITKLKQSITNELGDFNNPSNSEIVTSDTSIESQEISKKLLHANTPFFDTILAFDLFSLIKDIDHIDMTSLYDMDDTIKEKLKVKLKELSEHATTVIMRVEDKVSLLSS